jgi:predicted nucleotidyltransferase
MKDKYLNIAKKIILNHIDCDEINVFLFGSRVKGDSRRTSDIDIGFLGNEALDHRVFRKIDHRVFRKIADELQESIVPYHFDLIDFFKVDNNFKKIALQRIMLWNKAKNIPIN